MGDMLCHLIRFWGLHVLWGCWLWGVAVSVHHPSINTCMGDLPVWPFRVESAVVPRMPTGMPWIVLGDAVSPHTIVIWWWG